MSLQRIGTILLLLFLSTSCSFAFEDRFPRPEFQTTYQLPKHIEAHPSFFKEPLLGLLILIAILVLGTLSLYRYRSRKSIRVLSLLTLLFLGFLKAGCVCPIGSIQNIAAAIFNTAVPVTLIVLLVFFLPLLCALYYGRVFCGVACPLGALQDVFVIYPKKVPSYLDRALRILPYFYFSLAILFAVNGLGFIICRYDPFIALFRLSGDWLQWFLVIFFLLLGLFVARPYCRYLCPYSVLLRWFSRYSSQKVQIPIDGCVNCHLCQEACPFDVIAPPRPKKYKEDKERTLWRLRWLVALLPAIVAIGILFGTLLTDTFASLHREVYVARQLELGNRQLDEVSAFLINDGDVKGLHQRIAIRRRRLKISCGLLGGFWALIIVFAAFDVSRRRQNETYEVMEEFCLACGRCYEYCPRNSREGT